MEKVILGIDPGTNIMGYGLLKVAGGKVSMMSMGVIDLRKAADPYLKLGHIFKRVTALIDGFSPDEMAIEAPFFGKNVQSMLKLGRAQGTAIAAAVNRGDMGQFMDATDALAAAYCHHLQAGIPQTDAHYRGWKDFVNKNRERVSQCQQKSG